MTNTNTHKSHKTHKPHRITNTKSSKHQNAPKLKNHVQHRNDRLLRSASKLIDYCPKTGRFTWKASHEGSKAGAAADRKHSDGYRVIKLGDRHIRAHRLAWFIVKGRPPKGDIDHIDGRPANNKLSNLREASRRQNLGNARIRSDNTSGFKGVDFHPNRQARKWRARIRMHGERRSLGYFETAQEAHAAYMGAARLVFGEFARSA